MNLIDKIKLRTLELQVFLKTFEKVKLDYHVWRGHIIALELGGDEIRTISKRVFEVIRESKLHREMRRRRVEANYIKETDSCRYISDPIWDDFIYSIENKAFKPHREAIRKGLEK